MEDILSCWALESEHSVYSLSHEWGRSANVNRRATARAPARILLLEVC